MGAKEKALAVAYAVKRRGMKKMAKGGMVNEKLDPGYEPEHVDDMVQDLLKRRKMAKGGMVDSGDESSVGGGMEEELAYSESADDLLAWDKTFEPEWDPKGNTVGNEDQDQARRKARTASAMRMFRSQG